jgi:hypothetical protein
MSEQLLPHKWPHLSPTNHSSPVQDLPTHGVTMAQSPLSRNFSATIKQISMSYHQQNWLRHQSHCYKV